MNEFNAKTDAVLNFYPGKLTSVLYLNLIVTIVRLDQKLSMANEKCMNFKTSLLLKFTWHSVSLPSYQMNF